MVLIALKARFCKVPADTEKAIRAMVGLAAWKSLAALTAMFQLFAPGMRAEPKNVRSRFSQICRIALPRLDFDERNRLGWLVGPGEAACRLFSRPDCRAAPFVVDLGKRTASVSVELR